MRYTADGGGIRLKHVMPWIEGWALGEIYAGAVPQGATDATYMIGLWMEKMRMKAVAYCGGAVDISKFFDQVVRPLVYTLARMAGMPGKILGAYERLSQI